MQTFLLERDYVTFGYLPSQFSLSVVCIKRSCTLLSQLKYSAMFLAILYIIHLLTSLQNFTEIVSGKPLRQWLNARGVDEYSDVGHVEGYTSETAQDTIND